MKIFVTGVAGQLGHDVMNELASRGYTGVGTDLAESYGGIQDGSYVTTAEYVSLDITNSEAVMNTIKSVNPVGRSNDIFLIAFSPLRYWKDRLRTDSIHILLRNIAIIHENIIIITNRKTTCIIKIKY